MLKIKVLNNMKNIIFGTILVIGSLSLTGCAGSDVELQVPGLGVLKTGGKKKDPKIVERGPLVIPPNTQRLPEPGQAAVNTQQANQGAWPDDPDLRKKKVAELEKQKKKKKTEDPFADDLDNSEGLLDKLFGGKLF